MVKLKIDGKEVQIEKGATILAAAEKAGIKIPTLCYLQKVSPTGACRVCVVDIAGVEKPMTACNTVAVDGMAVTTRSERLEKIRRQCVELLLVNHPLDCPVCDAGGECDLQDVCYALDVTRQPFDAEDVAHPPIEGWPLVQQIPSRCILCEKCVKVCHEVVGASALVVRECGEKAFIDTVDGGPLDCEFCGNCIQVCPTGTLNSKLFKFRARPWELATVPSVCTYCGSHCEIDLNVKQNEVYRVTSEDGVTVNDGNLCIGGYFGYGYLRSPARLTRPMLKDGGTQKPAGWEEALERTAERLGRIRSDAGPEAIAGLASPRLTNEENYLFQKLFRAVLGSNNIDSEARFGALRTARVLGKALGLSGASNRIDRIGRSQAVLVFGDVTAEAPAIDWQIEKACRKHDGKLVVAAPRRVKLERYANTPLRCRPGSEAALATALAHLILRDGLADEAFLQRYVENLDALKAGLANVDLAQAAAATGLEPALLEEAARLLGEAETVAIVFCGDVAKSDRAEAAVAAIANLALVSGALHGDVGGLFPVDEKGNMQGLLDMGVCPEWLPGHQDYAAAADRFAKAWKTTLPSGGRDALGILAGIEAGEIKALYLAGVNPLVAFPEAARWRKALAKLDLLVVQDILASELTALADVLLPGAAPAEKTGSVTSLDQRVNCLGKAVAAPGEAREDFAILAALYDKLAGRGQGLDQEGLLAEIKELAPLYSDVCFPGQGRCRPCLKAPYAPADHSLAYTPVALEADAGADQGLQLLTGKLLAHFGTTSTYAEGPQEVAPAGFVLVHPDDARSAGLNDGDRVRLTSATGATQAPVRVSDAVPAGVLFAPYHHAEVTVQQVIPALANRTRVELAKA